jgi:aspartyl protease family protein
MNGSSFLAIILFFILGCAHPERERYERNQGTASVFKRSRDNALNINPLVVDTSPIARQGQRNTLKMEVESGVTFVWVEINGIRLRFIFDTGASSICISPAEATVLYRQGNLREEDVLDKEYFQDATGRISEGTTINLREVKVGNMVLQNVKALVVDNINAPLLLGQSVLERFGSIEIDNVNKEIIFK